MHIGKDNIRAVRIVLVGLLLWLAAAAPTATGSLADGASAPRRGGPPTAARQLIARAERGDARAQAQLGFMYEYGRGVPQNFVIAAHWYCCASEQWEPSAQ